MFHTRGLLYVEDGWKGVPGRLIKGKIMSLYVRNIISMRPFEEIKSKTMRAYAQSR